jgi:beta-lactam-binding protein with PASTA domain
VVTLDVNVGPARAKLPDDLVGQDVNDAEKELAAAGFTSVRSEAARDVAGDAAAGTVLSVDPREGQSVAMDEDILLRYARRGGDAAAGSQPRDAGAARSAQAKSTRSSSPTRSSTPPPATTQPPVRSGAPTSTAPTGPTRTPEPTATATATATSKPTATAQPTGSSPPGKNGPHPKKPKPTKKPKPPKGG